MSDQRPTLRLVANPDPEPDDSLEPTATGDAPLTDFEKDVLAFEHTWWKFPGAKEQAVLDIFGLSATRYYQQLLAIIDKPAALAHDPMLVNRLRNLRSTRARRRSAHQLGLK